MPDRSRRIRVTLFALAAAALLLAGAAFYVAITHNTDQIHQATTRAAAAATQAQAAAAKVTAVTKDFCTLLGDLATGHPGTRDADERAEAADSAVLYRRLDCTPPLRGPP